MIAFIFDTETSGLVDNRSLPLAKQPEVIEFFGTTVNLATGEILNEYETFIKPQKAITEEITRITGIKNADLETAPTFKEVAPRIRSFIGGILSEAMGEIKQIVGAEHTSERTDTQISCIAHNASFDQEILDIEFERLGEKLVWPPLICTVEATIHLKGFRLNLQGLHEHLFGEQFKGAHRARTDVMALVRCCCELYKRGEL